jgi:hypothetical protein
MIGMEPIGFLSIGIDTQGVNLFTNEDPATLEFSFSEVIGRRSYVLDTATIVISATSIDNQRLNLYESFAMEINGIDVTKKIMPDIAVGSLEIAATDIFNRGYLQTSTAALEFDSSIFITRTVCEVAPADLIVNIDGYNAYYTFNIQEFEINAGEMLIGGQSYDIYNPVNTGGGSTSTNEIPQIWIG